MIILYFWSVYYGSHAKVYGKYWGHWSQSAWLHYGQILFDEFGDLLYWDYSVGQCSMSKQRAVTSDSPQGSVFGFMTFNIFVGNLDSGISSPSDKFADCIMLWGAVHIPEEGDAIRWTLTGLKSEPVITSWSSTRHSPIPKIKIGWRMGWDQHWGERHRGFGCWEAQNNLQSGNTIVFQAAS